MLGLYKFLIKILFPFFIFILIEDFLRAQSQI